MILYHSSNTDYSTGDLIRPGNWGKKLFEIGVEHNCWTREIVLEAVRTLRYPHKPSRLKSAFACDNLETVKCYHQKNNPRGFLYEVEAMDKYAVFHKGDFNAVEPLPGVSDNIWTIADKYWQYGLKTSVSEWPNIECSGIVIMIAVQFSESGRFLTLKNPDKSSKD